MKTQEATVVSRYEFWMPFLEKKSQEKMGAQNSLGRGSVNRKYNNLGCSGCNGCASGNGDFIVTFRSSSDRSYNNNAGCTGCTGCGVDACSGCDGG